MSEDQKIFEDQDLRDRLKQKLSDQRAGDALNAQVAAMFAAPPSIPMNPRRWPWLAAAASILVVVGTLGMLILSQKEDHHDDEYLVAEEILWPAMAPLHQPGNKGTSVDLPTLANQAGVTVVSLPAGKGELVSGRVGEFVHIPAVVLQYRIEQEDVTVVCADARKILRDTHEVEKYHEWMGDTHLAGGNRGDLWVCALAHRRVPEDKLVALLDQITVITPPSKTKN